MKHNILDIENYLPDPSDKYLFDTNVLISLNLNFHSHENYRNKYSKFFKEILKSGSKLFLSSLILSEFVNTYLRHESKLAECTTSQYKNTFRKSQAYKDSIDRLKPIIKNCILAPGLFNRINDDFESVKIDDLFNNLKESDFNDEYSIHLCRKYNLKLVTHDCDFSNIPQDITVITANPKF